MSNLGMQMRESRNVWLKECKSMRCSIEHVRYDASCTEHLDLHALYDIATLPVSFTAGLPTFPCVITRVSS
jgi:hypothetical protein